MSQRLSIRTTRTPIQQSPAPRRLLQRQCDCGRAKGPSGQCAECARKGPRIQTRLTSNRPGDRDEREADQMADRVTRMPAADRSGESFDGLQRRSLELSKPVDDGRTGAKIEGSAPGPTPALGPQPRDLDGGRPLPPSERAFFESRFGYDFSQVRIHADAEAGYSAQNMSARAYTLRDHIVFGPGQYAPATPQGRRLLAHELAHVVQQRGVLSPDTDGAIQRQPESAQTETKEKSLGDQLRDEILKAAVSWEKTQKEIISKVDLWAIREGVVWRRTKQGFLYPSREKEPIKNYTTCILFAQRMFYEAVADIHKVDPQIPLKMAKLLPKFQQMLTKEIMIQESLKQFGKIISPFSDAEDRIEKEMNELTTQIWELQWKIKEEQAKLDRQLQEFRQQQEGLVREGPGQAKFDRKQREITWELKRTRDKLSRAQRRHDQLRKEANDLAKEKAEEQRLKEAWIKPETGVFTNRPKPGDFLLLGQPTTGSYGVYATTQETLSAGAFRHINVFQSEETFKKGEIERWRTIDGGGTTARKGDYYIRLADHLVFRDRPPEVHPDKPWKNTPPSYVLLGWVDINKLVEKAPSGPPSIPASEPETEETD